MKQRHVWQSLIKNYSITLAIVLGKRCYPLTCWHITPSYLPNHKSWEVDVVKKKLGTKMAGYFFHGASKAILPGQPLPTIIQPKGSVPKKGLYRDMSNVFMVNWTIPKWGTRLFTACDLAASLLLAPCHHEQLRPQ